MALTKFIINDNITLKLEDGKTIIYVAGKRFNQCKYLLLNILVGKVNLYDEISSIDEAVEIYDKNSEETYHNFDDKISPREEFVAHCSNLQAWYENNYDTRLLMANLAFPLLKRLTEVGDTLARKKFKEEIAKRLESGFASVVTYLIEEGYINYLTKEELYSSLLSVRESEITRKLDYYIIENVVPELVKDKTRHHITKKLTSLQVVSDIINLPQLLKLNLDIIEVNKSNPFAITDRLPKNAFSVRNNRIVKIKLSGFPMGVKIPNFISNFENLEYIFLVNNHLNNFPEFLFTLENLKFITIYDETLLKSIGTEKIRNIKEKLKKKDVLMWI